MEPTHQQAEYKKQSDDEMYRYISLDCSEESDFRPFHSEKLSYNSENVVLEILRKSEAIICAAPKQKKLLVEVWREDNYFSLANDVPSARLWLRSNTKSDSTWYKVPELLEPDPNDRSKKRIYVPAGTDKYELCGDKYFRERYILRFY